MLKSSQVQLDDSDKTILNVLQTSGRIRNIELAEKVHLSPPATHARVKRLEKEGVISGYAAKLDRNKTGHDCMCFISVSLESHQLEKQKQFFDAIQSLHQVLECHHLTGESDYLLKVVIRNNREMEDFITHTLLPMPGMSRVHTSVVLREIKSNSALVME
ncbi:MAG: AsnC family transcriptional regulator [Gammaproteobacteria bacterium]|nr:MAG: AsnC family transcriptional regulator [Gammaproteobacteria bacterium]PCJ46890.1 MAG: AsnC family transcriptional regulator [Gammaproteobacteria bacterium]